MIAKFSMLKMRIYCYVVNRNTYVRDAYQLPVDLDLEYHQKHRIKEWFRLMRLLMKYRILNRKPSEEELANLKEMQDKKAEKLNLQGGMTTAEKDDASVLREAVMDAINEIKEADLIRFSERQNIIIWGNGSGSEVPELVRKTAESNSEFGKRYRFVWLRNKRRTKEISTFTTFYYPWILMKESGFPESRHFVLTDEERRTLFRFNFLQKSVAMLSSECPQIDDTCAELVIHETYRYLSLALDYLKPRLVLIWNESAWLSLILSEYCDESDIPYAILSMDCICDLANIEAGTMHRQLIEKLVEDLETIMMKTALF